MKTSLGRFPKSAISSMIWDMGSSKTSTPVDPLEKLISENSLSPEELERRKLAQQHLKERLSSIPWYAEAEKRDPDFWEKFHASMVNY